MALLEKLSVIKDGEGERDCAINTLEFILNAMTYFKRISIDNKNCIIINTSCDPEEAIYFTNDYVFIPEKLVVEVFSNDSYLEPYDIINVLNNCRYFRKRILCEEFYNVLKVRTEYNIDRNIDCLTLDCNTLKEIISDFIQQ